MPDVPLRNRIRSAVGSVFRKPMIRAKNRFLHTARTSCRKTQLDTLKRLLVLNRDTTFARDHHLRSSLTVDDYRRQVPISDYEYFRPYIDRVRHGEHGALLGPKNSLLMFALSSGTTAAAKLIPITDQFVADYRRGWQHWGIAAHQDHPGLRYLKMVQIISRHNQWRTEDGTPCGSISGLVTSMQRRIVRKLYAVPSAVCEIVDPAQKRHAVARFAFADPFVGMLVTANPATLLQLVLDVSPQAVIRDIHNGSLTADAVDVRVARRLQSGLKPDPERARRLESIVDECGVLDPRKCWPRLACLGVWSGGSAGAYIPQLRQTFGDINLRDHGLHASEGRMTIPFRNHSAAGVLDIESHFFEFVPVEESDAEQPRTLMADELREGCDYYILLTTSSGLYRYNIHDVVRCTGFWGTTPLLEFRHKGAHMSSITGEKISEAQVVESVSRACTAEDVSVMHFTLTPTWGQPPHYRLFVGVNGNSAEASVPKRLAARCDQLLREQNCEYDEKRGSLRLGPIQCELLQDDAWKKFRRFRLNKTGGSPEQYKHPCLLPDPAFENRFLTAAGVERPAST